MYPKLNKIKNCYSHRDLLSEYDKKQMSVEEMACNEKALIFYITKWKIITPINRAPNVLDIHTGRAKFINNLTKYRIVKDDIQKEVFTENKNIDVLLKKFNNHFITNILNLEKIIKKFDDAYTNF